MFSRSVECASSSSVRFFFSSTPAIAAEASLGFALIVIAGLALLGLYYPQSNLGSLAQGLTKYGAYTSLGAGALITALAVTSVRCCKRKRLILSDFHQSGSFLSNELMTVRHSEEVPTTSFHSGESTPLHKEESTPRREDTIPSSVRRPRNLSESLENKGTLATPIPGGSPADPLSLELSGSIEPKSTLGGKDSERSSAKQPPGLGSFLTAEQIEVLEKQRNPQGSEELEKSQKERPKTVYLTVDQLQNSFNSFLKN